MNNRFYSQNDQKRLSGGKAVNPAEAGRSAFRKDYARLLHAASFRRLQGKTQLFPGSESDFFRNRLTHSLEVAQIAVGIAEKINSEMQEQGSSDAIDVDLVAFAGLAHDLGHPPFGHNGELALDQLMAEFGGFEGNAQTFRILTCTEGKLVSIGNNNESDQFGLDLTVRALAAVLKYDSRIPTKRKAAKQVSKGYYELDADVVKRVKHLVAPKFKGGNFKTVECSIMDLADDIAYSTYDLEDSLHAGFVTPVELVSKLLKSRDVREIVFEKINRSLAESSYKQLDSPIDLLIHLTSALGLQNIERMDFGFGDTNQELEKLIRIVSLVESNRLMTKNAAVRTKFTSTRVGQLISSVSLQINENFPQLSGVALAREALISVELFKHLNFELVIRSPRLSIAEYRGRDIVSEIFKALEGSKGRLLPDVWRQRYEGFSGKYKNLLRKRAICDYVSGMTDRFAIEFHERLFGDGASVFMPH